MENTDPNIARVQHVAKSSSDQLLTKFAEVGSDRNGIVSAKDSRLAKRVKRKVCGGHGYGEIINGNYKSCNSLAEKKSLLAPAKSHKSAALIRRFGVAYKAKIRASRDIKNKSIITVLHKTWRRTVEGASRDLMEKHYNRLINDSY